MESSGPAPTNAIFSIRTPIIEVPTSGSTSLHLAYLMYGSDVGSFAVEVIKDAIIDTIFKRDGGQHLDGSLSSWEDISLGLNSYTGASIQLQFSGMKLITGLGDIAIDNVQVCHLASPITPIPTMGFCALIGMGIVILIIGFRMM